jgi:hypothetical protein
MMIKSSAPDPESGAFLPQGSTIQDDLLRIPDLYHVPKFNLYYQKLFYIFYPVFWPEYPVSSFLSSQIPSVRRISNKKHETQRKHPTFCARSSFQIQPAFSLAKVIVLVSSFPNSHILPYLSDASKS